MTVARHQEEGSGDLFSGYRASVPQDGRSSGGAGWGWFYNSVNALMPLTVCFRMIKIVSVTLWMLLAAQACLTLRPHGL